MSQKAQFCIPYFYNLMLLLADMIINFFSSIVKYKNNILTYMKSKAFENKLVYYAIYDLNTSTYSVIHNYNNFLSIFWFYITNYIFKVNYTGVTYLDIDLILHAENIIVIADYVRNSIEYHSIFDMTAYEEHKISNKIINIIYAYTDKNEDLTYEFEYFNLTIFNVATRIKAQHIYNIILGYNGITSIHFSLINSIHLMTDDHFDEITIST